MFDTLYVITSSGLPLFTFQNKQNKENSEGRNTLFAGIFAALMKLLVEVEIGVVETLTTKKSTIYVLNEEKYSIVCIVDRISELEDLEFQLLIENLMMEVNLLTLDHEPISLITPALNNLFTSTFNRIIKQWIKEIKVSSANKKLQDLIW